MAGVLLAACQPATDTSANDRDQQAASDAIAAERKAVDAIGEQVRVTMLERRLTELEAQVSELRDGRQAIDARLLTQRLDAIQGVTDAQEDGLSPEPSPSASATLRPKPTSSPTPKATSTPVRGERND